MCSQALKIKLRRADGRTNKNKRSYRDHPLRGDLKIVGYYTCSNHNSKNDQILNCFYWKVAKLYIHERNICNLKQYFLYDGNMNVRFNLIYIIFW